MNIKSVYTFPLFALLMLVWASSCTKDEDRVVYQSGTAPVLSSETGADVSYADTGKTAITLSWTGAEYTLSTGMATLAPSYTIEIDTADDFSNPNKKSIVVTGDSSYSFLVEDLNDVMLNQLMLDANVPHTLKMRITSTLTNSSVPLVSNVVELTSTPYTIPPKVTPPASGQLFIVGSATAGGWNNPVPAPAQEFTQVSETVYELTIDLTGGQEYLLLPVNGSWDHKYSVANSGVDGLSAGGDFGYDLSSNFPGPANTGSYKITVNFQTGKFTVVAQ